MSFEKISPRWPAPPNIRGFCTTRRGGSSQGPFSSFNLGMGGGDRIEDVRRNREKLAGELPGQPRWLKQVHGNRVVRHTDHPDDTEADAVIAFDREQVCAVLTADCLPVLMCSRSGDRVAAAHAGWRGLAEGILTATVSALETSPAELMAWLGPAIGPAAYEVGGEVVASFGPEFAEAFRPSGKRWLMNLYTLSRLQLEQVGMGSVHGGGYCTFSDRDRFFSYRRDGVTGRMASVIWID